MKTTACLCLLLLASPALAAENPPAPSLTIYNQNFAVVRDWVPLDLQAGINRVRFADTTAQVETDSVVLRDPSGKTPLQILEQNYRNDPISQGLLLSLNEGKTIEFQTDLSWGEKKTVQGKVIRSGYTPGSREPQQPLIEVDGKLQFSLPGQPVFPALADDTILKPSLDWQISVPKPLKLNAELAYLTGGLSWEADYNIVAPETSDLLNLTGWVTFKNSSGKTFKDAKIKLMAGDVSKIQENRSRAFKQFADSGIQAAPAVTEKTFDEYHLYTLERPATLHDNETKQVEFIRATGVQAQRVYIYDGLKITPQYRGESPEFIRNNANYGLEFNPKVAVVREFKNSEENHLGIPLPKGRLRFYKQDTDGQIEFTGENEIDHTPKNEIVRVYTGNAFDLVGERRRLTWALKPNSADESFEIKLRNRKKEPVEIRVVEHLYRWINWEIKESSDPYVKTEAQTVEFRVKVKPDEEKTVTYTVHYWW